jgi:class 3 adenylate cyclase/tetratricopeptide (TPR) repeat protein
MGNLPEGTVTILFTDVEGSTALHTARGDEVARQILGEHEKVVRRLVAETGGHEIKSLGDGFMVAFASARRAVSCAVSIQRAFDDEARGDSRGETRLRIGLNSGEVIEQDGDLLGAAVNAAARIAAKAEGGQILVASVVKDLAGVVPEVSFANRGRFRLKGFPDRWQIFEVVWRQEQAAAPPVLIERPPLVGRDAERDELLRALSDVASGRGGVVMIGGEPGIGKTRLAEETRLEAEKRGFRALIGHCVEQGGAPYQPIVEILESAIKAVDPEALRLALGDAAPEVARVVPHLRRIFPDIPAPLELPPEQERRYLFNSIQDFLGRASAIRPQLLVLEDLHWADDATLLLLQHLAEGISEMRALLVGTYRDVELDSSRPLARTLEDFLRRRLARRVRLRGLSAEAVGQMLQTLAAGQSAPATLVGVIYQETEGNPFFVQEVFEHLAEEGRLLDATGQWRAGFVISDIDVPESIRLVIGRRLDHLSEDVRKCLTTAAVVGRSFSFRVLEAAVDLGADALLDAVDAAERARLVSGSEDSPDPHFAFTHELIRQTLLANVSLPRRQRLHLRVADAIEQTVEGDAVERATALAHHLFLAGEAADPARAARYLLLAGDQAMTAAAYEDALDNFRNALELHGWVDDAGRAEVQTRVGLAQLALGQWSAALDTLNRALDELERIGEVATMPSLCRQIAWLLGWGGRFPEALEIAGRGLSAAGDETTEARCHLLSFSGALFGAAGGWDASKLMMDEALEIARTQGQPRLLATVLGDACAHKWWFGEAAEAGRLGLEATQTLRREGALWDLANVLGFTELSLLWAGERIDEALAIHAEVEELARRIGHYGAQVLDLRFMEILGNAAGDFAEVVRLAEEDERICRTAGFPWYRDSNLFKAGAVFGRGEWEQALDLCRQVDPYDVAYGASVFTRGAVALYLAYLGRRAEALKLLDDIVEDFPSADCPSHWGAWSLVWMSVEAFAVLGDLERAAALYPMTQSRLQGDFVLRGFDARLMPMLSGVAAAASSLWTEAEEHFGVARQQAPRWGPRTVADVDYWEGWSAFKRGTDAGRAEARRLLSDAVGGYQRTAMPRHAAMAQELLTRS